MSIKRKIIFLGDSLTYGYGIKRRDIWTQIIAESTNIECVNKGINGDTTTGMLARFNEDVINEKPNYVHIMGGTNDLICGLNPNTIKANIMAMTQQALSKRIIPLIGISPKALVSAIKEPWKSFSDFDRVNTQADISYEALYSYSQCFNIKLINYQCELLQIIKDKSLHIEDIFLDGLHLNEIGNKELASIFIQNFQIKSTPSL